MNNAEQNFFQDELRKAVIQECIDALAAETTGCRGWAVCVLEKLKNRDQEVEKALYTPPAWAAPLLASQPDLFSVSVVAHKYLTLLAASNEEAEKP